ncbi:MAG: hypothetical protein KJ077_22150 [Anaerolineae bacterium]|nr:hypothetical protein [Anaerolineae bacterium]
MIGLDFPVKPEWIHAVHHLWQPEQSVGHLIRAALDQTMPELGGEKTRRNSLSIILRYFVTTTEGNSQSRRTASHDVWVAYSRTYPVEVMAPAYLAHLIAQNDVAQELSRFLSRRCAPGETFGSGELRQHLSAIFGQRKVVTNAASAFLRILASFGVLAPGSRQAEYQFAKRLPVAKEVFPLIVWTWWQAKPTPQIDLDQFEETPALAFLQTETFPAYWSTYQPNLWALDERLEGHRATLKHVEPKFFERELLELL